MVRDEVFQKSGTKSSKNIRCKVWIFTVILTLLITTISCLFVYLIDQQLVNPVINTLAGLSRSVLSIRADQDNTEEELNVPTDGTEEDIFVTCTWLSCDQRCLTEWFESSYKCDQNTDMGDNNKYKYKQGKHKAKLLSAGKLAQVAGLTDINRMFRDELESLLIARVPGTEGNRLARTHIIQRLESLGGWEILQDAFSADTPIGRKDFVNIVATLNPTTERRLTLACHYDSKYFLDIKFIGATDSAVPCAMMLDLAYSLDTILKASPLEMVTLQLVFFDGAEAFIWWTDTDSLYGSRHLASMWESTTYSMGSNVISEIDRMDMLVLLDLIGVQRPTFCNFFPETGKWFKHMKRVERRLDSASLLTLNFYHQHSPYFSCEDKTMYGGFIKDDHIPFLKRNVPCFHIIAYPFPKVWHQMEDNKASLDKDTIDNLNKMLQVFTVEYLHLEVPTKATVKPVESAE